MIQLGAQVDIVTSSGQSLLQFTKKAKNPMILEIIKKALEASSDLPQESNQGNIGKPCGLFGVRGPGRPKKDHKKSHHLTRNQVVTQKVAQ